MQRYKFSELTEEIVVTLVDLRREPGAEWQPPTAELTESELYQLDIIKNRLQHEKVSRLNEATVWGKAVYPLLLLTEKGQVKTWAEESLKAIFITFTLEGIADGLISEDAGGNPKAPHLVVIEGKKGLDAKDPLPHLYGAMLVAAKLNWIESKQEPQIVHGCYTIADSWTFLRGTFGGLETEKLYFKVETTREFVERFEAETILGILKAIVAKHER